MNLKRFLAVMACLVGISAESAVAPKHNSEADAGSAQKYKSFKGEELNLYAWEGTHSVLLTTRSNLNQQTMTNIASALDRIYEFYRSATGREPARKPETTRNGRLSIATVADTGAPGRGYLGVTGIELMPKNFDALYEGMDKRGEFDCLLPYEFGRNFWFFSDQLEYKGADHSRTIGTGYAVFMRFVSMEAAGLKGGPWSGRPYADLVGTVESLVDIYEANPTLSWENTLRIAQAPRNALGLNSTDFFASFLMRLRRDYGGDAFVRRLWHIVPRQPKAQTTQDAVDNFVVSASLAAERDLTDHFQKRWRWPVSEQARKTINAQLLKDSAYFVERYAYDVGWFGRIKGNGGQWKEQAVDATCFSFTETTRDEEAILIRGAGRNISIRIPVQGGMSQLSRDDGKTWFNLYLVRKE